MRRFTLPFMLFAVVVLTSLHSVSASAAEEKIEKKKAPADRVVVMYAGRAVEVAPVAELFARPRHPYTKALLECVPRLDDDLRTPLVSIDGMPPRLFGPAHECTFAPRCGQRVAACSAEEPRLVTRPSGRQDRCI